MCKYSLRFNHSNPHGHSLPQHNDPFSEPQLTPPFLALAAYNFPTSFLYLARTPALASNLIYYKGTYLVSFEYVLPML